MKEYYRLIKPGIVYGNAMAALAAFVFASRGSIDFLPLGGMLSGIMLVIAASCAINNVIDRDIDVHMERTKRRALVTGTVSIRSALLFAGLLLLGGIASLYFLTNLLTLAVALVGVLVYVAFYTPAKRLTKHSTLIGAVAGAVPPVVGYTAVTNTLDTTALLLFLILVCWQMVHFFAIALFRIDEYRAARLPVMPVHLGVPRTKILMLVYTALFAGATGALYLYAHLGTLYGILLGVLSLGWLLLATSGARTKDTTHWAKRMFFYSIATLLLFCIVLAFS